MSWGSGCSILRYRRCACPWPPATKRRQTRVEVAAEGVTRACCASEAKARGRRRRGTAGGRCHRSVCGVRGVAAWLRQCDIASPAQCISFAASCGGCSRGAAPAARKAGKGEPRNERAATHARMRLHGAARRRQRENANGMGTSFANEYTTHAPLCRPLNRAAHHSNPHRLPFLLPKYTYHWLSGLHLCRWPHQTS